MHSTAPDRSEGSSARAVEGVEAWDTTYSEIGGDPPREAESGPPPEEQAALPPGADEPGTGGPVIMENETLAPPSDLEEGHSGQPEPLR